jgi:hypothetical protein
MKLTGAAAITAAESLRTVLANSETWEVLYWRVSPHELWLMSYPDAALHGGGEPQLDLLGGTSLGLRLQHHGWVGADPNVVVELLIDRWCERRALGPLRRILQTWPNSGMTDGYGDLGDALAAVRSLERDRLDPVESELVHIAHNRIDRLLNC